MSEKHVIQRMRHDVRMRLLTVVKVKELTPHMVRITVQGPELAGFPSASPDDHAKLFFPTSAGEFNLPTMTPDGPMYPEGKEPSPARDYTPRQFRKDTLELDLDFVIHGDGPASTWAEKAKVGDKLGVGGPRGSMIVPGDYDHYVLVGDETALPAIGRWLEEMPKDTAVTVLAEIASAEEKQDLTRDVRWYIRGESPSIDDVLASMPLPAGDTFWWVATESKRARSLRSLLVEHRGIDKDWVKATGYWVAATPL
ncbi:siderophore-interacting protein [Luteibacter aegosomatissinici]|uniref:siderophore-interacting protein n=1 Tax=Luteibacter aegosomatissinici TaxID=2911539 RepID=UPI001FF750D7|nr:siderophore-interacting protein [Luteibacter aegosomatissinici]UPG92899.1 siderophore-interacting protein [Luteibacter aegosomatissinici]